MPDTMSAHDPSWSAVDMAKISSPVNVDAPYSTANLAGKTILITGGASGFGAAFARHWAAHGAHIILGDVNDAAGEQLAAELRSLSGSSGHHHYGHCDVRSWSDQVALFKLAVSVSPTSSIDAVVAGAGIVDLSTNHFDLPRGLDKDDPPPPPLNVLSVNLTGVMYTSHLALFYLRRNPEGRDRHLMLISSIAGIAPLPGQTEYTVSKHAVMGLFRAMRGTSWRQGVRVNVLAPYFVETSLLPWQGMALLAGGVVGEVMDVVDAATRLMADHEIVGRGLVVGPKGVVDTQGIDSLEEEGGEGLVKRDRGVKEQAVWEIFAHDYQRVDVFVWRYLAMLNAAKRIRGWVGTVKDLFGIWKGRRAAAKGKGKGKAVS
ncbi:hypothetical protein B0T14DRAFT_532737 [Immersiella caudata]|uniref:NAD(P)-binding protein n=1 Tax=Immersiella caudata TaxID=314043 RepID=A0AA39XF41_9PEZI|nr:hypothetical protein B0T14DRAFT_532737 [Immersiella caudata]